MGLDYHLSNDPVQPNKDAGKIELNLHEMSLSSKNHISSFPQRQESSLIKHLVPRLTKGQPVLSLTKGGLTAFLEAPLTDLIDKTGFTL